MEWSKREHRRRSCVGGGDVAQLVRGEHGGEAVVCGADDGSGIETWGFACQTAGGPDRHSS